MEGEAEEEKSILWVGQRALERRSHAAHLLCYHVTREPMVPSVPYPANVVAANEVWQRMR